MNALFREYLREYVRGNVKTREDMERLEEDMPSIYLGWRDAPNAALGGRTPARAYDGLSPAQLIDELRFYADGGQEIPDVLMDAVLDRGADMRAALYALLEESTGWEIPRADRAQSAAVEALMHMEDASAVQWYMARIGAMRSREDEVALLCARALLPHGRAVGAPLIAAMDGTENPFARESFADIVSELRLPEAMDSLLRHFETEWDSRAFYAFCLGRMGGPRAMDALERALRDMDLGYMDYVAVRDAYERLGGCVELEREDFAEDADYTALSAGEPE